MPGGPGKMRDQQHPGRVLSAMRWVAKRPKETDRTELHHKFRRQSEESQDAFLAAWREEEARLVRLIESKKDRRLTEERLAMQRSSLELRERAAAGKSESQKPQLESIPVDGPDEGWERVVGLYERLLGGEET